MIEREGGPTHPKKLKTLWLPAANACGNTSDLAISWWQGQCLDGFATQETYLFIFITFISQTRHPVDFKTVLSICESSTGVNSLAAAPPLRLMELARTRETAFTNRCVGFPSFSQAGTTFSAVLSQAPTHSCLYTALPGIPVYLLITWLWPSVWQKQIEIKRLFQKWLYLSMTYL